MSVSLTKFTKRGSSSVVWKSVQIRAESLSGAEQAIDQRLAILNAQRDQLANDITYDFGKSPVDTKAAYLWGTSPNWTPADAGLRFTHVGQKNWASSGIATRQQFSGDFDCEVQLEAQDYGEPGVIYLQVEHSDNGRTQATAGFRVTGSGSYRMSAQQRTSANGSMFDYIDSGEIAVTKGVTSLRVARRANLYYIIGQSADLMFPRILSVLELPGGPAGLKFLVHADHVGRNAEMLVKQIRISAADYPSK